MKFFIDQVNLEISDMFSDINLNASYNSHVNNVGQANNSR